MWGNNLPKCPYCQTEVINKIKEWKYNCYNVKQLLCQHCGIAFNTYYRDNKFSHIIPKSPSVRKRILMYLKVHRKATMYEIAKGLKEKRQVIESVMDELRGFVND